MLILDQVYFSSQSVDCRPTHRPTYRPTVGRRIGRLSTDSRPQSVDGWPTVHKQKSGCWDSLNSQPLFGSCPGSRGSSGYGWDSFFKYLPLLLSESLGQTLVQHRRDEYCTNNFPPNLKEGCIGRVFAREDRGTETNEIRWRCYWECALTEDLSRYDAIKRSSCYVTQHYQLEEIAQGEHEPKQSGLITHA